MKIVITILLIACIALWVYLVEPEAINPNPLPSQTEIQQELVRRGYKGCMETGDVEQRSKPVGLSLRGYEQ